MAEHGVVATGQNCCHPPRLLREHSVADRIYARVQAQQAPYPQPLLQRSPPDAERLQLPPCHHPVLPLCEAPNPYIESARLLQLIHGMSKCRHALSRPRRARFRGRGCALLRLRRWPIRPRGWRRLRGHWTGLARRRGPRPRGCRWRRLDRSPGGRRPATRSITVTSPRASSPPVTASTVYWASSHSVSVADWMARKIASTGPSPPDSPPASGPEGSVPAPLATGSRREPASTSNQASSWASERSRISSETIASRSSAVTCFLRSATSLKALKAALRALPSTWKPSCSRASFKAWRPECLPNTIEFDSKPTSVASMIS